MENLSTSTILKDRLSNVASDIATKASNAVQNLGSNKPSEESPISYKVVHRGGALVRSGYETTSGQVHQLSVGEVVTVVELVGRRARIITPIDGWISIETKEGVQIMRQCALQRRSQQNEAFETAFEKKFQKMKDKQGRDTDPRAERSPSGSRSPSPEQGSRYRDRRRDDSDDDRKRAYDPPPKGSTSKRRDDSRDRDYRDSRNSKDRDRDYRDSKDRDRDYRDSRDDRSSRRDRDRDHDSPKKKEDGKFVPKITQPAKTDGPVPKLTAPGVAPPPSGGGISAGASNDMFDFNPAGTKAAAPAPTGGSMDLLDMAAAPTPASGASLDLFANAPAPAPTPMLPVAGGGASPQDWNAFQSPAVPAQQQVPQNSPNYMNAFGGGAAPQPQAQGFMGAQMGGGGFMAAQQPQAAGWGAMGQAPMGMQAGNPGFPMGQANMAQPTGYSAAFGGGMAPGVGGMPGGAMGMGAANAQWGGNPAAGRGGMMPGATMPGQMGGAVPGMGAPQMGQQRPGGNNVDDLLSKAMDGVATMSFEQRKGPASGVPMQSNVPMNMMQQAPRGW